MYYLDEQGKRVYTLKVRGRLGGVAAAGGGGRGAGVGGKGGEGGGAREVLWRGCCGGCWPAAAWPRPRSRGEVLCACVRASVRASHVLVSLRLLTSMLALARSLLSRSLALCRRRQRTGRRQSQRTRRASRRTTSTPSIA
jgi:hypothetical protein